MYRFLNYRDYAGSKTAEVGKSAAWPENICSGFIDKAKSGHAGAVG